MDMMKEEYKDEFRAAHPAFDHWIQGQHGYVGSTWQRWAASPDRAIKEITESMLLYPDKNRFIYLHNILYSYGDDEHIIPAGTIEASRAFFVEVFREMRLRELGI